MDIKVVGANENNLKNISVEIPRNKLVVVTGVSGSGKSSLVFDTIFAEGQREFLESMSTYAQRSIPKLSPANVTAIEGLSPCIIIDQRPLARNPRSTVGTVTEVYTFVRLLFARMGLPILNSSEFSFNNPSGACEKCSGLGNELLPDLSRLIDQSKSLNEGAILHKTWKVDSRYWNIIKTSGFFDMDKKLSDFTDEELHKLLYSEPINLKNDSAGYVQSFHFEGVIHRIMDRQNDSRGLSINSYDETFFSKQLCRSCKGSRLNEKARSVKINDISIVDMLNLEVTDLLEVIDAFEGKIAETITPFIKKMLNHMIDVGIGYLTLNRSVATLSNGESQKVKLARQLGSSLHQLIYVLDEPTAGLHEKDVEKINEILKCLVKKDNTVIVVEHDKSVMLSADYIIDMGPGAGVHGGEIVAQGKLDNFLQQDSITARYLKNDKKKKFFNRRLSESFIEMNNISLHNLQNINVKIPKNVMTCITGVSGSGKSSLIDVLVSRVKNIIIVDQSPIGQSARSNPLTYTGTFDAVRKEFSLSTGQDASLFTFNGKGACNECNGLGYITMDMNFLGDIKQLCQECKGKRYKTSVLNYKYKNKNISEVLNLTIDEAINFFQDKEIINKLLLLSQVGLGYLTLGQSLDTLSGGEVQRVKLAKQLSLKGNIYVLDEPTRGLHFKDIDTLMNVLNKLVEKGNTVIIVEHNMDVIKEADWIIDLGPEGGKNGGRIIAEGTPEQIINIECSYTGKYLSKEL
ncbi:excinuclease ABC subunit UvrA [Bacteroides sp. 519]|uniref:ATP-binding cassette domain-containing protein n=1 Tax=Bacteroides sp. 519 TaxID=2302937 RepID=UPI0013D8DF39|nr:excinuclease ABC subunit UvrA [Bacteroides sp. 519]NDV57975.1 excinuclease ABC subunit UvrA [Bacteroides sp. 519]